MAIGAGCGAYFMGTSVADKIRWGATGAAVGVVAMVLVVVMVFRPATASSEKPISDVIALAQQGRAFKIVYNSSSLAGQIAAVESGLAVAALTPIITSASRRAPHVRSRMTSTP